MSEKKGYREYESIKAYVRIRPVEPKDCENDQEETVLQSDGPNKILNLQTGDSFQFEKVFGPESTNKDIFSSVIEKSWQCITKGVNLCVFTYGQTSSGKTHTMKGDNLDTGLVGQTLEGLFCKLGQQYKCCFEITMSYFEIYNETIIDLFDASELPRPLEVREDSHRNPYVENLTEKPLNSLSDANKYFREGEGRRSYAITKLNHHSSRSHVILQLKIKTKFFSNSSKTFYSTLMMADLAGSENVAKAKTSGQEQREGSNINKSLLSLSNIIMKLKNKDGVPSFRESKLTRILQPVLKENTATVVICTVNPSKDHLHESISTLRFGLCAGGIKVEIKQKVEDRCTPAKLDDSADKIYGERIKLLNEELFRLKIKFEETAYDLDIRNKQNEELRGKLSIFEEDLLLRDEQIKNLQNDIRVLNGIIEAQERSIKLRLDNEYQTRMKEMKKKYLIEIEGYKAHICELFENTGNEVKSSRDKKLKKMYEEVSQSLTEKEKDLSLSRNTVYKLQEDNRRLRRDLEEYQELHNFRARKVPLTSSPSVSKSAFKFSAKKFDVSPRPNLLKSSVKLHKPFPVFVGSSTIFEGGSDKEFDDRENLTFKSCLTSLNKGD